MPKEKGSHADNTADKKRGKSSRRFAHRFAARKQPQPKEGDDLGSFEGAEKKGKKRPNIVVVCNCHKKDSGRLRAGEGLSPRKGVGRTEKRAMTHLSSTARDDKKGDAQNDQHHRGKKEGNDALQ